jgi:DNA-binding response OmpR family regulator
MKPEVKVIACTGRGEEKRLADLKALGVPVCLTKPYNMEKLLTTIREVLDSSAVT